MSGRRKGQERKQRRKKIVKRKSRGMCEEEAVHHKARAKEKETLR